MMKLLKTIIVILAICINGKAQTQETIVERNSKGIISSVKFSQDSKGENVPKSATSFFTDM